MTTISWCNKGLTRPEKGYTRIYKHIQKGVREGLTGADSGARCESATRVYTG